MAAEYKQALPVLIRCVDSAEARNFWQSALPHLSPSVSLEYILTASLQVPAGGAGKGEIVVADWLDSDVEPVRAVLRTGARVVLLDDYGPARGEADLVVNSLLAPLAPEDRTLGRARVVSGAQWVQLPPEVGTLRQAARQAQRELSWQLAGPAPWQGPVQAVLVSFGGLARREAVQGTLEALAYAEFAGRVICIPAPDGLAIPAGLAVDLHPAGTQFHSLLAACDLAVIGGGLTLMEAACLGVPAVVLAVRSGAPGRELHQLDTARKLAQAGFGLAAGMAGDVSPEQLGQLLHGLIHDDQRRGRMAAEGMRLIDGQGLKRTVELIAELQ